MFVRLPSKMLQIKIQLLSMKTPEALGFSV